MIGEAACEGIVIASTRSSTAPDRAHVLLQLAQVRRRVPKDVDALRGGDREERRDRGGENERRAISALVIHDDTRARAESTR